MLLDEVGVCPQKMKCEIFGGFCCCWFGGLVGLVLFFGVFFGGGLGFFYWFGFVCVFGGLFLFGFLVCFVFHPLLQF